MKKDHKSHFLLYRKYLFLFTDSSMTMADSSKLFNSNRSPLGASAASAISGSANSANHSDTEAIDEDDDDLVNDHVI